ncbi:MAG TPA: universal stress protein [Vicinamibacterales bacterium]|jgi:nucleotide-binding universal stress UspA family protein
MTLDIKRILVPHDFSNNSERALDYAHELAVRFEASLHLVHVCEVPSMLVPAINASAIAYGDWSQRIGDDAERELGKIASRFTDVKVTTEVLFGIPPTAIVDAAGGNSADLVVMGTHGHGPMMHMLMGNVAERVVRGAPCPVLTVREPRVKETSVVKATALAGAAVLAFLTLLPVTASAQEMKQVVPGSEVFRTYCATCHGTSARGDGPLASSMKRKPANLTEIAKRNGGEFPSEVVFKIIDGRQPVRGHGGADMPVWGDAFSRSREAGDEERVKTVIQSLVEYLATLQIRASHEP